MPKILLVEDESIVAQDMRNRLEDLGYTVPAIVPSGEKVLDIIRQTDPDLILMDIKLEGDIDGIRTAELVKEYKDIPIIFLTAYADDNTLKRAKATEPLAYLIKPFDDVSVQISIEIALHKHKADLKIKESRNLLQRTLRSIADAVLTTDNHGNISFLNPAAESLMGIKNKVAYGQKASEAVQFKTHDDKELFNETLLNVIRDKTTHNIPDNIKLIAAETNNIFLADSCTPLIDLSGNLYGTVTVFHNITDSVIAGKQNKKSEEEFRSLVENSSDIIWTVDREARYTYLSPRVKDILGFSPHELIGKTPFDLLADKDTALEQSMIFKNFILRQQKVKGVVSEIIGKDGRHIVLENNAEPFFDNNKNLLGYRGVARDITNRIKLDTAAGKLTFTREILNRVDSEFPLKVLIAADHTFTADLLQTVLRGIENIEDVFTCVNASELLSDVDKYSPDILLSDLSIPIIYDEIFNEQIPKKYPNLKIIVLSDKTDNKSVKRSFNKGANAYLSRDADQKDLIEAISEVSRGGTYFNQAILQSIMSNLTNSTLKYNETYGQLTKREKEVLRLIVKEKTSSEIADELSISKRTVETHRRNIMKKLRANNTVSLIKQAIDLGFSE
ncbi:MAG: response regulator [Candidatus Kapabacteria bacterium]|jgi:PAS domain S-box-containing protein|nr:response regulator [Candidatus Kapabacteria bacterium]